MNNNHGSYRELLFDKRWLEKRENIIKRDNHQCKICSSDDHFVIHHKQYHVDRITNKKYVQWD